jgi:hypothetical protein
MIVNKMVEANTNHPTWRPRYSNSWKVAPTEGEEDLPDAAAVDEDAASAARKRQPNEPTCAVPERQRPSQNPIITFNNNKNYLTISILFLT